MMCMSVFHLHDGRDLRYIDTRKFGRLELVDRKLFVS